MTHTAQYANPEQMARLDGEPLVDPTTMWYMEQLVAAHVGYDLAENEAGAQLAELDPTVTPATEYEAAKARITSASSQQLGELSGERNLHAHKVIRALSDPREEVHPIYAASLLAPAAGTGSLWYPETLLVADQFGRDLVAFDESLRNADQQPYIIFIGRDGTRSKHISYGITQGHNGLRVGVHTEHTAICGCGQRITELIPELQVTTITPTVGAVEIQRATGNKSVFSQSDARIVTIDQQDNVTMRISNVAVPKAETPHILLPTGNLYVRTLGKLAAYDRNGEPTDLVGPTESYGSRIVYTAIGEHAVEQAIAMLRDDLSSSSTSEGAIGYLADHLTARLNLSA